MTISSGQVDTVTANLLNDFFDSSSSNVVGMPRIAPVDGSSSGWGRRRDGQVNGPWWMMSMMLRYMSERFAAFPSDSDIATKLRQQVAFLTNTASVNVNGQSTQIGYSDSQLRSAGDTDGTINASDDASWKMTSFIDMHKVTGDSVWLSRIASAVQAVLDKYKDTNTTQITSNGVRFSQYGIFYAVPGQDPNGQGRATLMESGLILASIYLYNQLGASQAQGYLDYAVHMAASWKQYHKDTTGSLGTYWMDLQIDPTGKYDGTPYLLPLGRDRPNIVRGASSHTIEGMFAASIINAQLYAITGTSSYLDEVNSIVQAMADYYLFNGQIMNDRDPWIDGYYATQFVREVLSIPNVDPNGTIRQAFISTAQNILDNGIRNSTYYSADWSGYPSGQNGSSQTGYSTWDAQGAAKPDNQSSADQIMTSANTGIVVIAGYLCSALSDSTLVDDATGSTLIDPTTNSTLEDA